MNTTVKALLTLVVLISTGRPAYAQATDDTLQEYRAGKIKKGYAIVYFTDSLYITDSKEKAYYYAHMYFEGGYSWDGLFCSRAEHYRRTAKRFETNTAGVKNAGPMLLEGSFRWYDEKGRVYMSNEFVKGYPALIEDRYFGKDGELSGRTKLDYGQPYLKQINSFRSTAYNTKGEVISDVYYGKNRKGKWKGIPVKGEELQNKENEKRQ